MNKGQEHAYKILEKIFELQEAFEDELNSHNDIYASYKYEGINEDSIAAELAENEDFIQEYLHDKAMELIKAVLNARWYGKYVAGFIPVARTREEWQAKSEKQTTDFFHDVNKTIRSFEDKMNEWKEGII